uniref:Uncharacterized protein n=1 Tax=Cannabis sativa TaxID=3483 RepID=A0A803QDT1_CANSA
MPIAVSEHLRISSSPSLQAFSTSRAKLTLSKSKNLDKACGGKVMATKLLKAVIESDAPRDRGFKLRPLVSSTLTELQTQTIRDDYYLLEIIVRKPQHGAPKGS